MEEIGITETPQEEVVVGSEEVNVDLGATVSTNNEIIAEIPSAVYGAFTKILSFLSQGMSSQDIFFINDGKLSTRKSSGIIYSDMSELFGDKTFEIQDPANAVKLMSLLKGGDKVVILKNKAEQQYTLSTFIDNEPDRIINLSIPDMSVIDVIEKPDLQNPIKEFEIDVDRIEDLNNAAKITDSTYFVLNFDQDFKLVSIELQNNKFKEIFSKNEPKYKYKLFDLMLVSKPDSFKLKVYKEEKGDIWIETISDIDIVEISYFEKLEEFSTFDSFTL